MKERDGYKAARKQRKAYNYCIPHAGALVDYNSLQLLVWWLSHVISIYLLIVYPLQAKTFLKTNKIHYVHAAIVATGLLAPTIPVLITLLADIDQEDHPERLGYRIFLYPATTCANVRGSIHFYTVNVPSNIMITTGVMFLLVIFWKLYKVRTQAMSKEKIEPKG